MTETIEYLAERYPDLGVSDLTDLKTVGLRFCKPVISRLKREEPAPEEVGDPSDEEAQVAATDGEATPVEAAEAEAPAVVSVEAAVPVAEPLAEAPAEDSEAAVGAA